MECAHCLEPINPGAKACRACGRKQPLSKYARRVLLIFAVMLLALVGVASYSVIDVNRAAKIEHLVLCARFHGDDKAIDAPFLWREIDALMASPSNLSWDDAYATEATMLSCSK